MKQVTRTPPPAIRIVRQIAEQGETTESSPFKFGGTASPQFKYGGTAGPQFNYGGTANPQFD